MKLSRMLTCTAPLSSAITTPLWSGVESKIVVFQKGPYKTLSCSYILYILQLYNPVIHSKTELVENISIQANLFQDYGLDLNTYTNPHTSVSVHHNDIHFTHSKPNCSKS